MRTGYQYAVDVKVGPGTRIALSGDAETVVVGGRTSKVEPHGLSAMSTRGESLPRGGHAQRVLATNKASSILLFTEPAAAGKSFRVVPTPVHDETMVVSGDSIVVPARSDGLETLVLAESGDVLYGDLTVHAAPGTAWGSPTVDRWSVRTPTAATAAVRRRPRRTSWAST
ncbi:hypothetical protein [Nocardioides yefusunii]|uniref:Uncharacterized protein n=1 Tax=Nocardioides yefusunii TaxID=2500546 RepID=A0ABW1QVS0_9ACTN|nr:hypothetical protein [Nocardioides yefusunii]